MTHLKRQSIPKRWPIRKKGTKFVVNPNFNPQKGIPLLIALRDMLKVCQNRKETKKAIHDKNILINNKETKDEKNSLLLFDTLTIIPAKKTYRLTLTEKGKYSFEEIEKKDSHKKITKIIGKKILKGKKVQINLRDGNNFLSDLKCKVDDSVIIDLKDKKIIKHLPLKEKTKIIIVGGKHAGKKGILEKIETKRKMAKLNISGKEINVLIKHIMVIE